MQFLSSGFGLARDPALVSLTAMVNDPTDVDAVEQRILDAVERYPERAGGAEDARGHEEQHEVQLPHEPGERAGNRRSSLIPFVINTGGIEAVETYYETLEGVTAEHLREAARRYLVPEQRVTVTMVQAEG